MQFSFQIELNTQFETLLRAGEAFYAARTRYHAYDGEDEAEEDRLCMACTKARLHFADACERFFVAEPSCGA